MWPFGFVKPPPALDEWFRLQQRVEVFATQQLVSRIAKRLLSRHYGHTRYCDFGPLALAALRQGLIDNGDVRTYINDHMGHFRRVFKWTVSQHLVRVSVYQGLTTDAGRRLTLEP